MGVIGSYRTDHLLKLWAFLLVSSSPEAGRAYCGLQRKMSVREQEIGLGFVWGGVKIPFRGTDPDSVAKKKTGEVAVTFLHIAQGGFWDGKQDISLSHLS